MHIDDENVNTNGDIEMIWISSQTTGPYIMQLSFLPINTPFIFENDGDLSKKSRFPFKIFSTFICHCFGTARHLNES